MAKPPRTKKSSEVAFVLEAIYKKGDVTSPPSASRFKYPKAFQCDNGSELKNEVTKSLEKHNVDIGRATMNYKIPIRPLRKPSTEN